MFIDSTAVPYLWDRLISIKKPLLLYGMGNGADKILAQCAARGITVSGVFASDGFVRKKSFHGFPVLSYSDACRAFSDFAVLLCFGSSRAEVMSNIDKIANERELYAPDVSVIGTGCFDRDYFTQNLPRLQAVYDLLADERSRCTFRCCVLYRLTGQLHYLRECESAATSPFDTLLRLGDSERYIDLGAYTGDTVAAFTQGVRDWQSIIAVEPDAHSYRRLCENTALLNRCQCINAAAAAADGTIGFDMSAGRQSHTAKNGGEVAAVTVDSLVGEHGASLIKLDVEGQESAALKGAAATIQSYKPRLVVAAYHRLEDYITLPEQILSLRGDYRVYMRHRCGYPAWDTDYLFI